MMTPADRRITELIEKWLTSIDLHLKYVELSDAAYARLQPWPKHDRPTRWVLEVARQKALELKAQCETRQAMGDGRFCESLELMAFLANLVGIQHVQRFVPLADPARVETGASASQPVDLPAAVKAPAQRSRGDEATREMTRPMAARAPAQKPPAPASAAVKPAAIAPRTASDGPKAPARAPAAQAPAPKVAPVGADMRDKIIADAVRLLKWGKSWHELTDLIERIAERPPAAEIRKVLRTNRGEIEKRASQG